MSTDQTDAVLRLAADAARTYLLGLDRRPVAAHASLEELRRTLGKALPDHGLAAEQVITELIADVSAGLTDSTGGRFFGWVIGGALPAGLAADWLTSIWDQNAVLYATAPAAAVAEEIAGAWLKDLLDLPAQNSFALVSGCQMAHVTCLAAARSAVLRARGWDVVEQGLQGAPKIRILANAQCHASIARAAGLIGLGRSSIEALATDDLGRVRTRVLADSLGAGADVPTMVVLQAGDIATGTFDRFDELIPLARAAGAWVHIDGAFGLWARASADYKILTRGCEQADSWATDGHKVLNTPFDCGYAIIAHAADHRSALSTRASYLTHAQDARDQIDWTPEWSRRARGFATYAVLRSLGREGVSALFAQYCEHTRSLAQGLGSLPTARLLAEPIINQALVRFHDPAPAASDRDHDRYTDAVIEAINATGEAFFTGSTWQGQRVMRICVCNWRTSAADVARALDAARSVVSRRI